MTCSFDIEHLGTSTEDVTVEVAPKSEMVLKEGSVRDPKTGELSTTYILSSGDNAYPARVTYRSSTEVRGGGSVRKASMTFYTWATKTDSVTGDVERKSVTASISFILPADMTIDVADFDKLIGTLFSFLYQQVNTKVRTTTWLGKLLYGATQVS